MSMISGLRAGICLSFGAAAAVPLCAAAQSTDVVTPAPTRDDFDRADAPRTPVPMRVTVDGQSERMPCPLDEPRFSNIRVTISSVRFDGLRALPPEALRPSYEALIGTSQPISVVCDIRDAATAILRERGFIAAVQVPPQTIENGEVRFDVLVGRLVAVHIRGDAGPAERTIASYLERIRQQEAFNIHEAERYLLLARELPGYDVRLVLKPAGTAPGELIGEVMVQHRPLDVDVNVQNYGSREVGRFAGLLRASLYGLTGLADRTTVSAYSTADFREQQIYQLSHDMRLGPEGLSLGGRIAWAVTRPGVRDLNDALRAKTLLATIEAGYGIVRSQGANLAVSGGLDLVDQKVNFGQPLLNEDKLRVLFARLSYSNAERVSAATRSGYTLAAPRWRIGGTIELRKGLSILGASEGCGPDGSRCAASGIFPVRAAGDPQATLVRGSAAAEFLPTPKLGFALSARGQYAAKPLFAFEEFTGGNYTIGRGYDPGAIFGDRGVGVQAEARLGSLIPRGPTAFALQPFAFVDAAWTWNEDVVIGRTADGRVRPYRNDRLTSAGGGVRVAYGSRAMLDLAVAVPLERAGIDDRKGDVRALLSLTVKLLPWTRN